MAKKLTSVVGIDIGSHTIKVAELRSKGREPEISALGIIETPEGAVDHTGVYNSDAVGDALKQVLQQAGVSVGQAIVSIAGQASVLVRTLEVPRMNEAELKEHMQWEINRNIPFAESNVISDFKQLADDDPNSPNMDVVMAIAPQSAIDTLIACVKRAGRSAVGIDVEPLAVARSLQVSYADEYENMVVCTVDMGHKTTAINIYRSGKLLMPRQIPIGGENFTKSIADHLGVTHEEAERLKAERGQIPHSSIQAAQAGGFAPSFGAPAAPDAFGGTQEFTPYNPFSDDPLPHNPFEEPAPGAPEPPMAAPHAAPEPPMAAPHAAAEPPMAEPYGAGEPPLVMHEPAVEVDPMAGIPPLAPEPTHAGFEPMPDVGGEAPVNPFDLPDAPPHAANLPPIAAQAPSSMPAIADDPEVVRVFNAYSSVLEEFVAEVRRSIDYFRSRGGEVNRILLCGGGTKLKGLDAYIAASMGLECEPFNPFQHLSVNERKIALGYAEDHGQEFAIAVGTALHIFYD